MPILRLSLTDPLTPLPSQTLRLSLLLTLILSLHLSLSLPSLYDHLPLLQGLHSLYGCLPEGPP